MTSAHGPNQLFTPGEVGRLFRVDPKTVTRWAKAGKLRSIRTPGGHRRFRATEVIALLKECDETKDVDQLPQDSIPGLHTCKTTTTESRCAQCKAENSPWHREHPS